MAKLYPEYVYKDTAFGDVNRRNHLIRADDLGKCVPAAKRECYATICRFPEAYREHFQTNGSVKGYDGDCYADMFWLDVDDQDLKASHDSAIKLAGTLTDLFGVSIEDLRIYFSGKKGFHVGIPTVTFGAAPSPHLPRIFHELARKVSETAGLAVDLSIYKHNSLLRLPNTINAKSDLWKIALSLPEFFGTLESILALAREPAPSQPPGPGERNEILTRCYELARREVEAEQQRGKSLPIVQPNHRDAECPRFDKVCMYRMMQGVPNGSRNEVCLRLAVHFRQKGMTQAMAVAALSEWNRHNESPLDEVEIQNTTRSAFENGYEFGCHDHLLDRYCYTGCYLYEQKSGGTADLSAHILSVDELRERFMAYVRERDTAKVSWGIPWLDEQTRKLAPGQVGMIMARAGVGKTALLINTLRANSELGIPSLFCSLEQLAPEIFERMAQNAAEETGERIESGFALNDAAYIEHVGTLVNQRFENAYVCDRDRLTVAQLKAYVKAAEAKSGKKLRLLCVDYLGRMKGEGRDPYQKVSELAIGLKEVAKECELAVICIIQVNRSGGKGSVEVTMDMARDSGQVEEAADCMVGMWRANGDEAGSGHGVAVPLPGGGTTIVPDGPNWYPVLLQLNKNRKGQAGDHARIGLIFRAAVMRFEPATWRPPVEPTSDGVFS